jgi:outer membrane cobalamin receptor
VAPGFRLTDSTLQAHSTLTRWILGEYEFRPRWTMSASAGVSYQAPGLYHVRGRPADLRQLRPERARHLDIGISQQVASSVRWQVTAYDRAERDILRAPDAYPRLDGDAVLDPGPPLYSNGLVGSSRGVELLVTRKSATGFSGWGSYSFGRTRQTDTSSNQTFWADFDQRHVLNLFGVYHVSSRTTLGATFRAASGFPLPAYLDRRNGLLVVGSRRNEIRLPAYARLDVRATRTFETFGRRLTAFGEVANVLDRANLALAQGAVNPANGEAVRFTTPMMRRRATVGILIEF